MTGRLSLHRTLGCAAFIGAAGGALGLCGLYPSRACADDGTIPARLVRQLPPEYPEDAPAGATGTVDVRVSVDRSGRVHDVVVLDGPEVFHEEARRAARRLLFEPATRDGSTVPGSMLVHFHFEDPHEPAHDHGPAGEIIVRAESADTHDSHARTTLDDVQLESSAGRTLAESITEVPGVQLSRTSGSAAKPIIRGHSERRLLLLYDGVRHESQKWGPDHAPEVDPFTAGTVTVIKGPAGARYGPDAIGGVMLVEPPSMRTEPGVSGKATVLGATNGRRAYAAARLDAVSPARPAWSMRVEGSFNDSAALEAPDYVLGNTAAREWSTGAAVQWKGPAWTARLRYHHFDRAEGVFYGVRLATPDEFRAQYEAGVPVGADLWQADRTIERPSQAVTHDRATLHVQTGAIEGWTWTAIYAFQRNHRLEFEQVRSAEVAGPQYDFTLRTHSLDVHGEGPRLAFDKRRFEPGLGVQGGFQENVYRGYSLIPNHRSFTGGTFAHGRLTGDHGTMSVAARYDHMTRTAFIRTGDFDQHVARGTMSNADCPDYDAGEACRRGFHATSLSVGGVLHAVPETLDLKLDLSRASRMPNTDELYLVGSAPSLPVYAVGDPSLGVETTWGLSPTATLSHWLVAAEVGAFANRVHDYIYFAPEVTAAGEPSFTVTIDGTWPEYNVRPITADFVGADGFVDVAPQEVVGVRTQASMVRATDCATGEHLVGIPPDQVSATLFLRPPPPGSIQSWSLGVELERMGKQSRVDPQLDFLPAPEGATLLHAEAMAELQSGERTWRVGLQGANLLDTTYREYTSLLRYYADQPGRDLRLRVSVDI